VEGVVCWTPPDVSHVDGIIIGGAAPRRQSRRVSSQGTTLVVDDPHLWLSRARSRVVLGAGAHDVDRRMRLVAEAVRDIPRTEAVNDVVAGAERQVARRVRNREWLDDAILVAEQPSNHSPYFAPMIDPTLRIGVAALVTAAHTWLPVGR
jgi:hypothetical protein